MGGCVDDTAPSRVPDLGNADGKAAVGKKSGSLGRGGCVVEDVWEKVWTWMDGLDWMVVSCHVCES